MAFEGLDLSNLQNLLKQYGGGAGAAPQSGSAPTGNGLNIRPNMAPPENFWQGDDFKIGAPGMQAVPPGQAPPPQAPPTQMPPQMGPQGGGFDGAAYLSANPDVASYYQQNPNALKQFGGDLNKGAQHHYNTFGKNEGRSPSGGGGLQAAQSQMAAREGAMNAAGLQQQAAPAPGALPDFSQYLSGGAEAEKTPWMQQSAMGGASRGQMFGAAAKMMQPQEQDAPQELSWQGRGGNPIAPTAFSGQSSAPGPASPRIMPRRYGNMNRNPLIGGKF